MKAVLLVVLLVLPGLSLAAPEGAATRAVWWGATDMLDGWHVRIPVNVTNTNAFRLMDATVGYDLAIGEHLVAAGWPSVAGPGQRNLQGFELDEASIRVVEYRALGTTSPSDGLIVGEVASRVRLGSLGATRLYNNRTTPDVHVEWRMPGPFDVNASRYFMIYADATLHPRKEAARYDEAAMGPIEGRYWISKGTTLYGLAAGLLIAPVERGTTIRIETYQGGRPRLLDGLPTGNPFVANGTVQLVLGDTPTPVRLTADRPIVAAGIPSQGSLPQTPTGIGSGGAVVPPSRPRAAGPVPSIDGGLAGTQFLMFDTGPGYVAHLPRGSATVTHDSAAGATLTPSAPTKGVRTAYADGMIPTSRITSTAPVLIQHWANVSGKTQFPSLEGAPAGSRLVGLPFSQITCASSQGGRPEDGDCRPRPLPCTVQNLDLRAGELLVGSHDARHVWVRTFTTGATRYPIPAFMQAPAPERVGPEGFWRVGVSAEDVCPVVVEAASPDGVLLDTTALLTAVGGGISPERLLTPLGGPGASRFHTMWPVSVIAYYPGTQVEVRKGGRLDATVGLGAGDLHPVSASATAPAWITSNKPIAVIQNFPGGYFVGVDRSLRIEPAGLAEFRGFLVSLGPADGSSEPIVKLAGPGKPVNFPLRVENLALDHRGRGVADTIRLGIGPLPAGWDATLQRSSLRLEGGGSAVVNLTVIPPADAPEGARLSLTVTATSEGNPAVTDAVRTVSLVRAAYALDAWFDSEGGPKLRSFTLDQGVTRPMTVVVKNLATVHDRILIQATPFSAEWGATFERTGTSRLEVELAPGETFAAPLLIRSPTDEVSQTIVEVSALSLSSEEAVAKIAATVRVRADVRIDLWTDGPIVEAVPGGVARFQASFQNLGTDRVSIRFNTSGAMPPGWPDPVVLQGSYAIDEISGVAAGTVLVIDVSVQVPSTARAGDQAAIHFFVETLPQFVGDPVAKRALDLLAITSRRHDATLSRPPATVSVDETGTAVARAFVRNEGNGPVAFTVVPRALPHGTTVLVPPARTVPAPGEGVVGVDVRFSPETLPGVYPIAFDITTEDGFSIPWVLNVSVPQRRIALLTPQAPVIGNPGLASSVAIEVRNLGNVPLPLPPVLDLPEGWWARWAEGVGSLDPGRSALLTLEMGVPASAMDGVVELPLGADWASGASVAWTVRTVGLAGTILPGESGRNIRVGISNTGTGDAQGVEVVLMSRGGVVDRGILHRIPAGGNATLVLSADGASPGSATVRIDSTAKYSSAGIDLPVDIARDGVPGIGILGLIAILLVGSITRRRGRA